MNSDLSASTPLLESFPMLIQRTLLFELLPQLTHPLDPDAILQLALQTLCRLERWPLIDLSLPSPDRRWWQCRAANWIAPGAAPQPRYPMRLGVTGRAYRSGQLQDLPEAGLDPDYFQGGHPWAAGSELAVPLVFDNQVLGVLNLESDRPHAFDPQDVALATACAQVIALALQNARQLGALQREVSERQQAEAALHLSEEKLRQMNHNLEARLRQRSAEVQDLYENAPCGYHSLDPAGAIIQINQTELSWLGYPRESMLGQPWSDFLTPANQLVFATQFLALQQHGQVQDVELELVRSDGSNLPVLVSSRAVYDAEGNFVLSRSTVLDNRERQRVEDARQQSEDKFRRLFHASPVPSSLRRLSDERFVDVNQAFLALYGFHRAEVLHHTPSQLGLPDCLLEDDALWEHFCAQGQFADHECLSHNRLGQPRHLLVSGTRIHLDGEEHVISTLVDITPRKQAEAALYETQQALYASRDELRNVLGSLDSGVVKLDAQGRVWYANEVFARHIGLPQDSLPGKTLRELFPPDFAAYRMRLVQRVFEHGRTVIDELPPRMTDGHPLWLRVTLSPVFDAQGQVAYVVVMGTDITSLKQTQQRLERQTLELYRANAALQQASRAKNEFMAMISHELRTPLTAILGISEALEQELYGPLSEIQKNRLGTVRQSGEKLLGMINDILDFSRMESGRFALSLEPVDLSDVCLAALQAIQPLADKKNLQVDLALEAPGAPLVSDPHRLQQMLGHLLSNAVKFTGAGGRLGLEVKREAGDTLVRFSVWDTGIGISAPTMARLFQPFVQLDCGLNRQYGGTGMGLAYVYRLAEQMGGSVGVESQPGQGSRFWFLLPRLQREAASSDGAKNGGGAAGSAENGPENVPAASGDAATNSPVSGAVSGAVSGDTACVLIADDNPLVLQALSEALQGPGYRVIAAASGEEAIRRAQEFHPHLILMDAQMPILDGVEATRRLRSMPDFAATPIIALSALCRPGDREICLNAGADVYAAKPVTPEWLVGAVEEWLKP